MGQCSRFSLIENRHNVAVASFLLQILYLCHVWHKESNLFWFSKCKYFLEVKGPTKPTSKKKIFLKYIFLFFLLVLTVCNEKKIFKIILNLGIFQPWWGPCNVAASVSSESLYLDEAPTMLQPLCLVNPYTVPG